MLVARTDEALLFGIFGGGSSIAQLELVEDVMDVILHSGDFYPKPNRYFFVAAAAFNGCDDFLLSSCKFIWTIYPR
ncbi:hypothetical protein YTPLAS18_03570 [Nitrospira sp.]|nr:hypothetical protein YTPLAS18_03570 [Nitrospira sp.]